MTRKFLQFKVRRGLLALASWIVWPIIAILIDFGVRLSVSTSRGCSIEGCNFDPGILDALLFLSPPIYLTVAWWRHRRRARFRE